MPALSPRPGRRSRPALAATVFATLVAGAVIVTGGAGAAGPAGQPPAPFEFVALGDMPYHLPEDRERFDRLIDRVNGIAPVFAIHVGDTKSGSSECSDEILEATKAQFLRFAQPLVYTPGDNEWTDCHRKAAGGYDPLERLAKVRALHFSAPESLGAHPMPVVRQSDVSDFTEMVENLRWEHAGVVFATLHVVGSNNGFERTEASVAESALAGRVRRRGLLLGDTHLLVIDQPLKDNAGRTIETAFRLQVMGDREVHAVRVGVDPADPAVFSFRPVLVPENLTEPAM